MCFRKNDYNFSLKTASFVKLSPPANTVLRFRLPVLHPFRFAAEGIEVLVLAMCFVSTYPQQWPLSSQFILN